DSLDHVHIGMGSALHPLAAEPRSDMGALIYSVRRLPAVIARCRRVILGQSPHGFRAVLGQDILDWEPVKAPARRRRWYYDGKETLAGLIGGSHIGYARAAGRWWQPIQAELDAMGLSEAPIYFVSSNVHSLVNVLSGTARRFESRVVDWTRQRDPELWEEAQKMEAGVSRASRDNWLYFAARALFDDAEQRPRLQ